jgi:hypothetical protein
MKKTIFMLCALAIATSGAEAKKKKATTPVKPRQEVRTPAREGLFNVQHWKDNYYFQIPDSLLGRLILVNTRFVSTPVDAGLYGGELANSQVLYFEKRGKTMYLRANMYDIRVDSTAAIAQAVANATQDPIVWSGKIDSTLTDSTGCRRYSIDMTQLLNSDNSVLSISETRKTQLGLTGFKKDLSYIDYIHTFPINTEVVTVKTFGAKATAKSPGKITGSLTLKLNTSFVLLPKDEMAYRSFDPRVGYFTEGFYEYGDDQQRVDRRDVITRWRLVPKDVEAYRRGELVEPVKQIVYYIDPATPKKWVPYLIAGVNDWNAAFEAAGFKNAITAKEWPNDSTMSLEDARFSVIRYLASDISNAYGPHVSDPRTGEIIESHVGWYHNVMELLHGWYQIQAGAVDPRARHAKFDDELMGQLIRFVSSHEIGHTLGLRHNMGASFATPVDSLRSKAWVEKYGHTASIMDYARFNYVAQPEDNISEAGIFPRINDYDKWAIEWGYRYFPDLKNEKEERLALNKMTIAKLNESQRYWFGGEGSDNDPRAQTEDLGNDAMKASDYGVRNLKRIVKQLPEWNYEEGDLDENLKYAYKNLIAQMGRYAKHVYNQISGTYHDFKSADQQGVVYTPLDAKTQKRALKWLNDNIIKEPTWLVSEPYTRRFNRIPENLIFSLGNATIDRLTTAMTINLVSKHSYLPNGYKPMDYINDLVGYLFSETASGKSVNLWTREMQRRAVSNLIKAWRVNLVEEQRPFALAALQKIKARVSAAGGDAVTRAHYADLALQIKLALEGRIDTRSSSTTTVTMSSLDADDFDIVWPLSE